MLSNTLTTKGSGKYNPAAALCEFPLSTVTIIEAGAIVHT